MIKYRSINELSKVPYNSEHKRTAPVIKGKHPLWVTILTATLFSSDDDLLDTKVACEGCRTITLASWAQGLAIPFPRDSGVPLMR